MFIPTTRRLRFAAEKCLTADQSERRRPCVLLAMIATERWTKVLRGPVNDDGRESARRDCPSANDGREDDAGRADAKNRTENPDGGRTSRVRLDGLDGTGTCHDTSCRHELVGSRFANPRHVGLKECAVCASRIWTFWRIQTCVDCGAEKHDGCDFAGTATGAPESTGSARNTSSGVDEVESGERTSASYALIPARVHQDVVSPPSSAVDETACSSNGAVGPACSGRRVRATAPAPIEAFEEARAVDQTQVVGPAVALKANRTGCGSDGAIRPACSGRRVRATTPAPLESFESPAGKTEVERTAVSAVEADETTVSADRPVAIGNDDRPRVDPIVRRSPTVREENIKLFTKCKMLPRKNARWEMSNYMKTVNRFLHKPQEQMSVDHLIKYWVMQNRLFSRFSMGILLDEESFFSVCPEALCVHIANKCRCETIVDPFCGAGGNIIQFTKTCSRVIGIDVDAEKIRLARNNATVYGVQNRMQLRTGDYFQRDRKLKADVVFMSPPWGGPEYINEPVYSLAGMCSEHGGGRRILEIAREIAPKIAIHLPRNLDKNECVMLARDLNFKYIRFENNYIENKMNSTTVYLS